MSENEFIYLLVFVYFGGMMKKCHHGNLSYHSKWSTQIMAEEDKEIPQYQHFQPAKILVDSEEKYKSSNNTNRKYKKSHRISKLELTRCNMPLKELYLSLSDECCFVSDCHCSFIFICFVIFYGFFFYIWSFVCNVF